MTHQEDRKLFDMTGDELDEALYTFAVTVHGHASVRSFCNDFQLWGNTVDEALSVYGPDMRTFRLMEALSKLRFKYLAVSAYLDEDGAPSVTLVDTSTSGKNHKAREGEEYAAWSEVRDILAEHGYSIEYTESGYQGDCSCTWAHIITGVLAAYSLDRNTPSP